MALPSRLSAEKRVFPQSDKAADIIDALFLVGEKGGL